MAMSLISTAGAGAITTALACPVLDVGWGDDVTDTPSPIERIKSLHGQGHSLAEAKRIVHAALSDEERAAVERLWEELDARAGGSSD